MVYRLIGYTDPSTGTPSFDGTIGFIVTSGTPPPRNGYFNLSSVPTSTLSVSWQKTIAAWRANQTLETTPVEYISVAVCSPKYSIEPWLVDLVNGSTKLVQLQSERVGNLDPTQLNIAIQDSFSRLTFSPPLYVIYGLSIAQLTMLFAMPRNMSLPGIPHSSEYLTLKINAAIPIFAQAYLDDFPFGKFTPPRSQLLVPALVLSAELKFICIAAALYALLSGVLFHLFRRTVAKPFTIKNILDATHEVPHAPGVSRGRAFATKIEDIAIYGNDVDDSATEARVNKAIGNHYTMVLLEDSPTNRMVLQIDSQQWHAVTPNIFRERYENIRIRSSRFSWAFTPTMGAMLVAFGISAYRNPRVISISPQNTRATLLSALFTWTLGLWRTLSLVAVSSLVRRANSNVRTLRQGRDNNSLRCAMFSGMEPSSQAPRETWLEPKVARNIQRNFD